MYSLKQVKLQHLQTSDINIVAHQSHFLGGFLVSICENVSSQSREILTVWRLRPVTMTKSQEDSLTDQDIGLSWSCIEIPNKSFLI
jgi:hypothetical protein